MTKRTGRRSLRLSLVSACAATILATGLFTGLAKPCFAGEPKPDPSGIATGDKNAAVDAAGNPFVVAEPTDKTAPDYPAAKKSYDEYQAEAAREPLATSGRSVNLYIYQYITQSKSGSLAALYTPYCVGIIARSLFGGGDSECPRKKPIKRRRSQERRSRRKRLSARQQLPKRQRERHPAIYRR